MEWEWNGMEWKDRVNKLVEGKPNPIRLIRLRDPTHRSPAKRTTYRLGQKKKAPQEAEVIS